MKRPILFTLFLLIISFFCYNINAQNLTDSAQTTLPSVPTEEFIEMSLEDLMDIKVVTASKTAESIQDAPAIISIISSKEIEAYGALTLVDVLNRATDLYMTGSYYFPNNLAAMRGDAQVHTSSHVLILIDGRPCRESFYGGVDLAVYNTFPVSSIEKIEIIRGPGSVLYGTNAVSGVINIITKQSDENEGQVTVKAGSFGTKSVSYQNTTNVNGLKINSGLQYLSQDGWDFTAADASSNHTVKTMKYGQENVGLNINASYKNFTFKTFYGNTGRDVWGDKPNWNTNGTFNRLNTYRGFADLGYKHDFTKKWSMSLNETYNSFSNRSLRDGLPVNFHSEDYLTEMTHYFTVSDKFNIVAGALINNVTGAGDATNITSQQPTSWVSPYNEVRWATYVQADYKVFKFLKLIGGAQYNKTPNVEGNLAPRAGFIAYVTPELGIKGLYGQAFKSAAQSDKYSSVPASNYGNPDLKPELISTTDIQIFYVKSKIQANVGVFYTEQVNSITRIPYPSQGPGAITYANQGYLNMQGLETEFKWKVTNEFNIQGNFSYQTNINDYHQRDVTAISNYMAKAGVNYQKGWFNAGIFNSFFSKPADVINSQDQLPASSQRVIVNEVPAAFNILTANVSVNMNKLFKWTQKPSLLINVYGDNLLDEHVFNPEFSRRNINSLPARGGRSIFGGVTVVF